MANVKNTMTLGEGITFSSIKDDKFKHNGITISFITKLCATTISANAILPYIMRKSTGSYPDFTALERHLSDLYGASLNSDISKYGNKLILSFSITFIDDKITIGGEIISSKCAALLADMVLNPNFVDGTFVASDFKVEQQNLVETIESEINNKRGYALKQCQQMMFSGTDLALSKFGTVDGARALTPQIASEQYKKIVDESTIDIAFIGCGDSTHACNTFKEVFDKLDRHHKPFDLVKADYQPRELQQQTEEMEISQGKLVLGFRTQNLSDSNAARIAVFATALYGGTPTSKLFLNVRERLSLCYYCAAAPSRATNSLTVDIGVEHQNKQAAQDEILAQLKLLQSGEISDSELDQTKLTMINSYRGIEDSISSMDSWYFTRRLLGEQTSPQKEIDAINTITKEQVQNFANSIQLDSVFFLTNKEAAND